jgi:hypothetical protein
MPPVRSETSTNRLKPSTCSTKASGRCGSQSRQLRGDGSDSGARTTLKLGAPSLVRMRKAPSTGSTSYSTFARRGATTRGGAPGDAAGTTRHSDVVKLCVGMSTYRPLRERETLTL